MATYVVEADIVGEMPGMTFSATSKVTSTTLAEWIDQVECMVNGLIGSRYVTPITATEPAKIMKMIVIQLVVCRVEKRLAVKTPQTEKDQGDGMDACGAEAWALLKKIKTGLLTLDGATLVATGSGVTSFNVEAGEEHTWKKGIDQW